MTDDAANVRGLWEKYRFLIEWTNTGFVILDQRGVVRDANPEYVRLTGHDELREILGRPVTDWTAPHDLERNAAEVKRCLDSGGVRHLEIDYLDRDGRPVTIDIHATVVPRPEGVWIYALCWDISGRKRLEASLRESQERLHALSANLADGMVYQIDSGPDGRQRRFSYLSPAVERFHGLTVEEVRGDAGLLYRQVLAEDRPRVAQAEERALASGRKLEVDVRVLLPSGEVRWRRFTSAPRRSPEGNLLWDGIEVDVTGEKEAEAALVLLQHSVEVAPDAIFWIDRTGRLVYLNAQACRSLGYSGEELLTMHVWDVDPRVTPASWAESWERFREMGTIRLESIHRRRDGSTFPVEISSTFISHQGRELVGGIARDITMRTEAEERVRRSEERFRTLAATLPLTVFETDLEGRLTYVNRAGLEIFGYSQEEVDAGLTISRVIAPADRERAQQIMSRRLAGLQDGYIEYQGLRKDGSTLPITVNATPIREQGRTVGLRGVLTDLTERKQLETERQKADRLESVGTLAGGIAHDFNNLLQGIFGYISLARLNLGRRQEASNLLQQAERALHQTVSLTSQLLTFATGGRPVTQVLDLGPLIKDALRFALSGSRVEYSLMLDADLAPVEADRGQFGQVIQNVVLNAEQAMPSGGWIEISARNTRGMPEGRGRVEITIRDQGHGIPAEHLEKIFDPYFTTKEKGSGLGLATAYSIVRNHGGTIGVRSEPGSGTTFTITLPAAAPAAAEDAPEPSPVQERRGRVLLMDDEQIVRDVAVALVQALGHQVDSAAEGAAAVEMYREALRRGERYDVVILDLTVRGGLGGMRTLEELLRIDPDVRAVVSSGYSADQVLAAHREHGFAACLRKPYTIENLGKVIQRLL
jgi:PAS domain S-box-containing protein